MSQGLLWSGFVVFWCLILFLSLFRRKSVTNGKDFALAGRSLSSTGVAAAIVATLIGGAATIGTAEKAFTSGWPGLVFTLGSGTGCLLLGLFFAEKLHRTNQITVSAILGQRWGIHFQRYTSFCAALGMFIHVIGQLLAATTILCVFMGCNKTLGLIPVLFVSLMFVILGGIQTASVVGKIKIFGLFIFFGLAAAIVLKESGVALLQASAPMPTPTVHHPGLGSMTIDLLATIIGVLSTQTYLQSVFSARNPSAARRGALLAALLIPPIGFLSVILGMGLHSSSRPADFSHAFSGWIFAHIPSFFVGMIFAMLLLTVLGTVSGLVLGMTTTLTVDLLPAWRKTIPGAPPSLRLLRWMAIIIFVLAGLLTWLGQNTHILTWSFISMGIRGSAILPALILGMTSWNKQNHSRTIYRGIQWILYAFPVLYVATAIFMHG